MEKIITTVRIPKHLNEELAKAAKDNYMSNNSMLITIIKEWSESKQKEKELA